MSARALVIVTVAGLSAVREWNLLLRGPTSAGRSLGAIANDSRNAASCGCAFHSDCLYVSVASGLGLLDGDEGLFAAQHPLLPRGALRTGLISRLYGALSI